MDTNYSPLQSSHSNITQTPLFSCLIFSKGDVGAQIPHYLIFIDRELNDDGQERLLSVIASPREPQEAGPGAEGLFQTTSQEEVPREESRAAASDRFISKVKCVLP